MVDSIAPAENQLEATGAASENTPLLSKLPDTDGVDEKEAVVLIKYSVPIWCTQIIECTFYLATLVSVGKLGVNELAAASLGSMTANLLGISYIIGFAGALDTLGPQAWTSDPKSMGLHCQRVGAILACMIVPQMILFWNAEPFLLLLKQDEAVANLTGVYLKIVSLGLPGMAGFEIIRRWLQSQGIMHAPTIVVVTAAPINIGLIYLLVWSPIGYGFAGAPTAMAVVPYYMLFASLAYCSFFAPKDGWDGLQRSALDIRQWAEPFRLGCSTMAMIVAEWWALEILTMSVAALGPAVLATQASLGSTQFVTYQFSLAIATATSVRVGNLIGAAKPEQASKAARTGIWLGAACGLATTFVLLAVRPIAGKAFTDDPEVLALFKEILPIVAFYQVFDSVAGVAFGILRGLGRSHVAALITGFAYWIIGIPAALSLIYLTPLKLAGLWLAVTASLIWASIFCTLYIWRIDFNFDVQKAIDRAGLDSKASPPVNA